MGVLEDFETKFGAAGKPLSRLIRPMIAAKKGRTLVWSDWSAIEARTLPWLADSSGAREVLDVIAKSDADPKNNPDLYCREAANIEGTTLEDFWDRYRNKDPLAKALRQTGKVAVLSLGFGGAVGALQAMAAGYRIALTEAEAKVIVDTWRENNRWARRFWDELWKAFLNAFENAGTPYSAGRLVFVYDPDYSRTMHMFMPDGRPLAYPNLRWTTREVEDERGNVTEKTQLCYRRGDEVRSLWYGVLAENPTQGIAGSLLRTKLTELSPAPALPDQKGVTVARSPLPEGAFVIGHTHDEIIAECDDSEASVAATRKALNATMTANPDWLEGCPLAAEVSDNWYYSKATE